MKTALTQSESSRNHHPVFLPDFCDGKYEVNFCDRYGDIRCDETCVYAKRRNQMRQERNPTQIEKFNGRYPNWNANI